MAGVVGPQGIPPPVCPENLVLVIDQPITEDLAADWRVLFGARRKAVNRKVSAFSIAKHGVVKDVRVRWDPVPGVVPFLVHPKEIAPAHRVRWSGELHESRSPCGERHGIADETKILLSN
jgi:hypothetical protein